MSGFNSFLGGIKAGQGAKQQRQSAFNASMLSQGQQALQAEKLDHMKANRKLIQDAGAAYETGDFAGAQVAASQGGHQDFRDQISKLSTEKRTQLKDEVSRKGQIAAALSSLPPEQQIIGIQTYGKEFGIDDAALQQAEANPSEALAKFSSSIGDIEAMIEQSTPEAHPDIRSSNALAYENLRALERAETPVTLVAQAAERLDSTIETPTPPTEETKTAGNYRSDGRSAPRIVKTAQNPETVSGTKAVSNGRETVHLGEDIAPLQLGEILKILKLDGTKFIRTADIEGDGTFAFIDIPLDVLPSIFEEPPLFTSRYRDDNNVERAVLAVTPDGGIGAVPFSRNLSIDGSESHLIGNVLPSRIRDAGLTGLTTMVELGVSGGGAKVISRGKLKGKHSELPLTPGSGRPGARYSYNRGVPSGFPTHEAFKDYGKVFKDGLSKLGYPNATPILRGSSVSGASYEKGTSFYKGEKSDFDLAIVDADLFNRLQELGAPLAGRNTRTFPLIKRNKKFAKQVGLMPLQEELKKNAGGRKTSFVVYKNVDALVARQQPFRKFPR